MDSSPGNFFRQLQFLLVLFVLFVYLFIAASASIVSEQVAPKERLTHLRFYFHEIINGPDATGVDVVNPPKNSSMGYIGVFDDLLKEGPETSSKLIGRGQGIIVTASKEDDAVLTAITFVFTEGKYNGSTFTIYGRALPSTVMERSIVGGSGLFRMARGYTLSKIIDSPPELLVVEYDAYIFHYEVLDLPVAS